MGHSGAFQRCEVPWPAKADSTGCPDQACLGPSPPGLASSSAACGNSLGPPGLSLAERLRSDKPETRLQCLLTKHRDSPLGSPPPSRPCATSGEEGLPTHSQARQYLACSPPETNHKEEHPSPALQQEGVWLDTKKNFLPRRGIQLRDRTS